MNKHKKPIIDESIDREELCVDNFRAAMQAILQPETIGLKSENREPTKTELEQHYKMVREK